MKLVKISFVILILGIASWWGATQYIGGDEGLPPLHTETVERGEISQRVVRSRFYTARGKSDGGKPGIRYCRKDLCGF